MFQKHIDPGLPPLPALMVDASRNEAYINLRVPDWRSVERGRYATKAVIFLYGIVVVLLIWFALPRSSSLAMHVLCTGVVSTISVAMSSTIIRSVLPDLLSRQIFARRLKIAFTPDCIAFKSWYYDIGVRVARRTADNLMMILPIVENDVEAKAYSESLPARTHSERNDSRRHLSEASHLTLMLRSGTDPDDTGQLSSGRRFRTLPVAGMEKKIAERLVILIDAAMEMTARAETPRPDDQNGRDLDLRPN